MKTLLILMYCLILVCYSCNINSQSNVGENKTEQENVNETLVNHVYDKMVAQLSALKLSNSSMDSSIVETLSQTNFQNLTSAPIQLTGAKCPFAPYMLVVYDNKLDLLNIKLDSIYTLDLKNEIQTALWSPFNKSEIYILTIDDKRMPGAEYTYATNLKLYCLNLNSMQLSYLTTFIDYTTTIYKIYGEESEPPTFFGEMSSLEIDKSKKMICISCYFPWEEDGSLPNLVTYNYNIKSKTTKLSKRIDINTTQNIGKKLESIKPFYSGMDGENYITTNDSVELNLPDKNIVEIKIPISIFKENDIKVTDFFWRFNAYFLKDRIVFSVSQEDGMDKYKWHVYLMDSKGKLLKMLGKDMSDFFQLSELKEQNYLIDPYDSNFQMGKPGLYLYNSDFNLLKQYKNVYYYELNQ